MVKSGKTIAHTKQKRYRRKKASTGRHFAVVSPNLKSLVFSRLGLLKSLLRKGNTVTLITSPLYQNGRSTSDQKKLEARINKKIKTNKFGCLRVPTLRYKSPYVPSFSIFIALLWHFLRHRITDVITLQTRLSFLAIAAAKVARIKNRYVVLSGIGFLYEEKIGLKKILHAIQMTCFKKLLAWSTHVFIQNPRDALFLREQKLIAASQYTIVNGAGVDLNMFPKTPLDQVSPLTFLYVGRLQEEKGFFEYCEAVKIIRKQYPGMRFRAIGGFSEHSKIDFKAVAAESGIHYDGDVIDVLPHLKAAHVVILPSYDEATPKALLEALAVGRPIITTNVSGCKETVTELENGYLVDVKDPWAISNAMRFFIEQSSNIPKMAEKSRALAEEKFDVRMINNTILNKIARDSA